MAKPIRLVVEAVLGSDGGGEAYTQIDIDHAAGGNLRVLSAEEAWETIEDCAQCDKQWKNPTSTIPDQTIANLKTQLVENEVVRVKIPKCMAWLDDEPIRDLNTMEDKVDNPSPQSTLQVLPSFEVYTPPVTHPEEVEETIVLTTAVATTVVADTSAPVPRADHEPVHHTLFADSTSMGEANPDTAGPSQPADTELSSDSFFFGQDMDAEDLQQAYVPKWIIINDSALYDHDVCRSVVDHLAPHFLFLQLRIMDYKQLFTEFKVGAVRLTCLGSEVRLRLEHELKGRKQFERKCVVQADWLRERDVEIASLKAQLSLRESEPAEAIHLRGQISTIEAAEAAWGWKNRLKQCKMKVRILSEKVTGMDTDLMRMALHLDEEFYPLFLTTIYLTALGGAIGRAIDKGMQDGLTACINHGRAKQGLAEVAAYNPVAKVDYVSAVSALRDADFPLLAQLASHKDASMSDLMDLLRLEGPASETLEANQMQPSLEQLMLPIHRREDQVVIGETSLSFSLDVIHARVQRIRVDVTARRLSLSNVMVLLIEPLSTENLIGEESTFVVPANYCFVHYFHPD
ncbi:hypothetical protein Tco_0779406 [Tanacetum coccineum]